MRKSFNIFMELSKDALDKKLEGLDPDIKEMVKEIVVAAREIGFNDGAHPMFVSPETFPTMVELSAAATEHYEKFEKALKRLKKKQKKEVVE